MSESEDEEIKKWAAAKFEKLWRELKNEPRGFVIKNTRKYVAKLFFYAGMNTILQLGEEKDE